jgi:hypothetical protein
MDLPAKQQIFDFEHVTELGKKYDGQFTALCSLNVGQKHMLELEKTRLLGNFPNPTDSLDGIAIILSNLRAKLIDGPPWWTQSGGGYNIEDEDALVALYSKLLDVEAKWKTDLKEKALKLKEKTSQQETSPDLTPAVTTPSQS